MRGARTIALGVLAALIGCGGSGDGELGTLDLPVENERGEVVRRLDRAALGGVPSRRAGGAQVWELEAVLGEALTARDTVLAARDAEQRTLLFRRPVGGQSGPQPVLAHRDGRYLIALLDADAALPPFDTPPEGEPMTRLVDPAAIRLVPWAPEAHTIAVTIDGASTSWSDADLRAAGHLRMGGGGPKGGERGKQLFDLRALARHHAGPAGRVTSIEHEAGTLAIDAAAWGDETAIPVLKISRRGALNFRWVSAADHATLGDRAGAKGVRGLALSR